MIRLREVGDATALDVEEMQGVSQPEDTPVCDPLFEAAGA